MKKLLFERQKYGRELLIDATSVEYLDLVSDTMVTTFYTLMFLKKASGTYLLDTEEIVLQDHMVLFVRPGQINYIPNAAFKAGHFLFFEGDFLDEFLNDQHFIYKFPYYHNPTLPSYLILEPRIFNKYNELAAEILEEITLLSTDSNHVLRSLIYYLLVRLNQLYAKKHGGITTTILEPRLRQFLKILQKEIITMQSVQQYADYLKISRVHLNKLCQKYFSKTAYQMIREQLLSEVKKEIKYADKGLAEIAYNFNFSAPSHFTRFFKQMTNLTPHEYREQME